MKNQRVLVVAAHPDDADFYCGGAVAFWISKGATVHYVICTDGAIGADSADVVPAELAALRKKEQSDANAALGVRQTVWLDYPDFSLPAGEQLRKDIARQIRRFKPHILATFDPWLRYELHPDHTVAGRETIYARLAARLPLRYPDLNDEGLLSWPVERLFLFKTDNPNTWIDTEDFIKTKFNTLKCHASQFKELASDDTFGLSLLKQLSKRHPETGRIAEPFRNIPLEGLEGLMNYISL
ncbi:MAG TPA: PIG-L family deacetylase [bacterium]|nr:PIG-L family deacetylase [bacterium]